MSKYSRRIREAYLQQLELDEGFQFMEYWMMAHQPAKMGQYRVCLPSGRALFASLSHAPIRCFNCGLQASTWLACFDVLYRGTPKTPRLSSSARLNLYADNEGALVMMTQDHIIPVSYGGSNDLANLRPACALCNSKRGNTLTAGDVRFILTHRHLIRQGWKPPKDAIIDERLTWCWTSKRFVKTRKEPNAQRHEQAADGAGTPWQLHQIQDSPPLQTA
jgi:hypothetical protein